MKILLLLVAGTKRQHETFFPSFNKAKNDIKLDLLYITRDFNYFPTSINTSSFNKIFFENKFSPEISFKKYISKDKNNELKHRAFGAYRYYSFKYYEKYDIIICLSDDVFIRRDFWIRDIVESFSMNSVIGVISNQIRNNPRHLRAPFFAITSKCISILKERDLWIFNSDHDAEQRFGEQIAEAGFIAMQLGNSFNLCTDYEWNFRGNSPRFGSTPLPYHILEKYFYGEYNERRIFNKSEVNSINKKIGQPIDEKNINVFINSNELSNLGKNQNWNLFFEFQPFDGLIHNACQYIAFKEGLIKNIYSNQKVFLEKCGWIYNRKELNFNYGRYYCSGVNRLNPIITI